jgi:hypothetical protein
VKQASVHGYKDFFGLMFSSVVLFRFDVAFNRVVQKKKKLLMAM